MQHQASIAHNMRALFTGRRGRNIREYATAYLMIAPAILLIFIFGIFPVGFALFVSLHKWLLVRGEFRGLRNYLDAIGNLTYIVLFAAGIGAILLAIRILRGIYSQAKTRRPQIFLLTIPALLHAWVTYGFFRWVYFQLPEFLDIATKMRGLERTRELFFRLLSEAFHAETVYPHWQQFRLLFFIALAVGILSLLIVRLAGNPAYQLRFTSVWLALAGGIALLAILFRAIRDAYAKAIETGVDPGIWPQFIVVVSGILLLVLAWFLWKSAEGGQTTRSFILRLVGALVLMVGAVLLVVEIPSAVVAGDKDMWNGLKVTVFFSLGTVPVQLSIAMLLAVLLFQRPKGSDLFRILFFLPYVTPAVASATVFRLLFSDRQSAPVNAILRGLGIGPQLWLREPDGVFSILAEGLGVTGYPQALIPGWIPTDLGAMLADWLTGPSMALMVIITLSVWTFVGYNTVIYLAGLGNISSELTEAAEIDGANKWAVFRHITFPLLSPTTYFLSLIAIMGTFKAFNTIWVLRIGQALGTTDTFSVVIFQEFFQKSRYGYASALAFVLFGIILGLTYINSKLQGSRVFYG